MYIVLNKNWKIYWSEQSITTKSIPQYNWNIVESGVKHYIYEPNQKVWFRRFIVDSGVNLPLINLIWFLDFWCLTPLSAVFQLYHGDYTFCEWLIHFFVYTIKI
jgi:hypothetical protein